MPSPTSSSVRVAVVVAASSLLLGACRGPDVADPVVGGAQTAVPGEQGVSVGGARSRGAGAGARLRGAGGPVTFRASDVLRAWDAARSRAFAEGDVAALRALYVEGSAAGRSDTRLLRAYLRRGLRVQGMRMQLLAVDVLREEPGLLRLGVTDRLVGAVAVGDDARAPLPRDQASTRLVELRRSRDGRWRVATVRESARRPGGR